MSRSQIRVVKGWAVTSPNGEVTIATNDHVGTIQVFLGMLGGKTTWEEAQSIGVRCEKCFINVKRGSRSPLRKHEIAELKAHLETLGPNKVAPSEDTTDAGKIPINQERLLQEVPRLAGTFNPAPSTGKYSDFTDKWPEEAKKQLDMSTMKCPGSYSVTGNVPSPSEEGEEGEDLPPETPLEASEITTEGRKAAETVLAVAKVILTP